MGGVAGNRRVARGQPGRFAPASAAPSKASRVATSTQPITRAHRQCPVDRRSGIGPARERTSVHTNCDPPAPPLNAKSIRYPAARTQPVSAARRHPAALQYQPDRRSAVGTTRERTRVHTTCGPPAPPLNAKSVRYPAARTQPVSAARRHPAALQYQPDRRSAVGTTRERTRGHITSTPPAPALQRKILPLPGRPHAAYLCGPGRSGILAIPTRPSLRRRTRP